MYIYIYMYIIYNIEKYIEQYGNLWEYIETYWKYRTMLEHIETDWKLLKSIEQYWKSRICETYWNIQKYCYDHVRIMFGRCLEDVWMMF